MRHDLLHECNRQGVDTEEFVATFCERCRQRTCERAAWGSSLMDRRVATQEKRLLHPTQLDTSLAKYGHLVDFESMLHRAAQLEIADRKGDWEVPEIPVTDGQVVVRPADQVDAAVRAMGSPPPEEAPTPELREGDHILVKDVENLPDGRYVVGKEDPPAPTPPSPPGNPKPTPKTFTPPTGQNAPTGQGVMIDGGPPPSQPQPQAPSPEPVADPWAPPPGAVPDSSKPKIRKVAVGATVRMGKK